MQIHALIVLKLLQVAPSIGDNTRVMENKSTDPQLLIIRKGLMSMRRQMLIIAPIVLGLGLFMIALHAFNWDPEAYLMPRSQVVLLYGFALLFCAVGGLGLWMGLIKAPRSAEHFLQILQYTPMRIRKVYPFVVRVQGGGDLGARYYVRAEIDDGTTVQIASNRDEAPKILDYIEQKAGCHTH